jgi:ferredoxin
MAESQSERAAKPDKVGAVMVVGGGICGMQSALDLANSGFKVYLVEEEPSIGGRMAQLDKTFPTNDCSMCMISPKLIEVGKHLNIEIITNAQLESLDGEEGRFTATVKVKPRYIDPEKCTGCGLCAQSEYGEDILRFADGRAWVDRMRVNEQVCIQCGECANACLLENESRQAITDIALERKAHLLALPEQKAPGETLMHDIAHMSIEERGEFWRRHLSKCIKCYGCREVCPVCICEECELEDPQWVRPGRIPADYPLFHLIAAYHLADRCVGCGACQDTCPMGIPLLTMMHLARIDREKIFEYVPGLDAEWKAKIIERADKHPIGERKVRA